MTLWLRIRLYFGRLLSGFGVCFCGSPAVLVLRNRFCRDVPICYAHARGNRPAELEYDTKRSRPKARWLKAVEPIDDTEGEPDPMHDVYAPRGVKLKDNFIGFRPNAKRDEHG